MPSLDSPFLLRVVPRAVIVVVALVAVVPAILSIAGADDVADGLGGDFPSFYGAGRIVIEGDIDDLYDPDRQLVEQAEYHEEPDEYLFFAYPPFVAAAYAGIAWLPYGIALTIQSLAALAALIWAIATIVDDVGPAIAVSRANRTATAVALALVTYPILVAILGGQNTTFTLLILALAWRSMRGDRALLAGLIGSLLMYKPQFGIVLAAVFLVLGRWRALLGFVVGSAALFVVGLVLQGPGWVGAWLEQVREFGDVNAAVNGDLMVNLVGWFESVVGGATGAVLALSLTVVVLVVSAVVLRRIGTSWAAFGPMVAGLLLVAPSALFYDTGAAIVAFGAFSAVGLAPLTVVIGVVAVSWSQVLSGWLGWSPLFVVLAGMWSYQAFVLLRDPARAQPV